jgi:tRNA-dihydrouridine synthase B
MEPIFSTAPVPNASPTFFVGDAAVYGDAILAPMDGFSDWPFRSLCSKLGSAMSYTEFVRAEAITRAFEHVQARFTFEETERPVVFQIYADDPDELLEAALRIRELSPDIIDINMGCPSKSVSHHGAGVGMMRTPLKVARTFRKLTAALDIPVTGKIRLGWDDCRNYRLIARIVEENGGAALAIHGRTKEQSYGGQADWDAIAEVKQMLSIPVIGNGDVKAPGDIDRMKEYTGCDAVMVGRGAIGNPWIFSRMERAQVTDEMVWQMVEEHLEKSVAFYGTRRGLILFRKHATHYLKLQHLPKAVRTNILLQETPQDFLTHLETYYEAIQSSASFA